MPIRMFVAHSFAREKLNAHGELDPHGISDMELADLVTKWIDQRSQGAIEVVRTLDPFQGYISSTVRRDISSSDAVLCLFTMRTKDHLTKHWITSTYVISEAAAALMQFPSETDAHSRLFGLVEEQVDAAQLGMAFHANQAAPRFRRDNLAGLQAQVERIVDRMLNAASRLEERQNCEYLSMDKVVSIWKNGGVWVQTRHTYRFTKEMSTVRFAHKLWRVSRGLPPLDQLLKGSPNSRTGFLRMVPLRCGPHDPTRCDCLIRPGQSTSWDFERNLDVEFRNVHLKPGEQLRYEIAWGYPHAFQNHDPSLKSGSRPNSVGLRTSERGRVASASLTLQFERDWHGEPYRILEGLPQLYTTHVTDLPGARNPEDFFHNSDTWRLVQEIPLSPERSSNHFEVYHWSTGPFLGMAKAVWVPHLNYFEDEDPHDVPAAQDTEAIQGRKS